MSRSRIAIGAIALVGALVAVWLLLSPPPAAGDATAALGAAPRGARSDGVSLPDAARDAQPITTLADTDASPVPPSEPAAAPAPVGGLPELSGEPLTIRGQVVDGAGQPIEGATAWYFPNLRTLRASGLIKDESPWVQLTQTTLDERLLPHVLTDRDGRFEIRSRGMPNDDRTDQQIWREPCGLAVVITCEGKASRAHGCPGLTVGDYDTGVIEMSQRAATMTGRVVQDGQPVSGMSVRWIAGLHPEVALIPAGSCAYDALRMFEHAVTGDDGRFRLAGLWEGSGSIVAQAGGTTRAGMDNLPTEPGSVRDVGDLELRASSRRSGTVLDEAGRPVAGATVHVTYYLPKREGDAQLVEQLALVRDRTVVTNDRPVVTAADGSFEVEAWAQRATLIVDAPSFEPARTEPLGPDAPPVTVRLQRASAIVLSVLDDASGAPVAGATVRAFRQASQTQDQDTGLRPDRELSVRTATEAQAAGIAAAPGIAAPESSFVIDRAGRLATYVRADATGYASQRLLVPGLAPGERRACEVRLRRERVLTGQVRSAAGQPIRSARVQTEGEDGALVPVASSPCLTAPDGRFEVRGLAPGTFRVVAGADDFLDSDPQSVVVPPGGEPQPLEIVLQPAGRIEGVVYDVHSAPLPGAAVSLAREIDVTQDPSRRRVTRTDVHADFVFRDLKPGRYTVEADPGASVSVDLAAGQVARVELAQRDRPRLHGRLLVAGAAVSGARVTVQRNYAMDDGTREWMADNFCTTADDGSWSCNVDPGTCRVAATSPTFGITLARELVLDWNDDRDVALVLPAQRIEVQVLDGARDVPLPGARAWVASGQVNVSVLTKDEGRSSFALPPGDYSLGASNKGFSDATIDQVVIGADGAPPQTLRLMPAATLRGAIWTASGQPAVDGTVVVFETDGVTRWRWPKAQSKDGRYVLEDVAAGSGRVRIHRAGWDVHRYKDEPPACEASVTLVGGEERTLDFTLPPP